jgi:hypothetical protein
MEPRILAIAGELADELFAEGSPADLVDRYARRLPLSVICELLGLPLADRPKFTVWASGLTRFNGAFGFLTVSLPQAKLAIYCDLACTADQPSAKPSSKTRTNAGVASSDRRNSHRFFPLLGQFPAARLRAAQPRLSPCRLLRDPRQMTRGEIATRRRGGSTPERCQFYASKPIFSRVWRRA